MASQLVPDDRIEQLLSHLDRRANAYGPSSLQADYSERAAQLIREALDAERIKHVERILGRARSVEDTVIDCLVEAAGMEERSTDHFAGLAAECMAAEAVWDFINSRLASLARGP